MSPSFDRQEIIQPKNNVQDSWKFWSPDNNDDDEIMLKNGSFARILNDSYKDIAKCMFDSSILPTIKSVS